jgi:hypothetical protein
LIDDPRDPKAYRIAIGMLGLAFIFALVGVCWVAAEHKCPRNIPVELWFLPAATGGVFVGALIPFSIHRRRDPNSHEAIIGGTVLAVAAVATGAVGATVNDLLALCGVGTALGGMFLGLFIPSPGRRDP